MAYLETDSKRFALLLDLGTHQGELKKFFVECRAQLLFKGAKVQNIPHGRDERIRAISERFTRRTDDVLRSWFVKNVSVTEPMPIDEVLLYLSAHFEEGEPLPDGDKHAICRSALVNVFSDRPSNDLVFALRNRQAVVSSSTKADDIDGEEPEVLREVIDPSSVYVDAKSELRPLENFHLSELLAAIILNDEVAIDNALGPFGDHTQNLVDAMLRVREGDLDKAREVLPLLEGHGPESELVRSALARASHAMSVGDARGGVRTNLPEPLGSDPSLTTYEIVGVFTNETETGAVFVDPVFLVLHGKLYELSADDRVRLFPESGSVMSHRTLLRRQLSRNDYVHWSVSERDGPDGRRTRYHLNDELAAIRRVVSIDVPSVDADEVRNRIKEYAATHRSPTSHQPMFLLSDGVVVGSPKDVDITRDDAFEAPWQAWATLETWLIGGHQYHVGNAAANTSHVDLSPLDVAFRRILKNLDAEQRLSMTKVQRSELSSRLRHYAGGEVAQRAKRVAASIDQLLLEGEELEAVLRLVNGSARVNERVEELVSKDYEARRSEKTGLQAEIQLLRNKKGELEIAGREIDRANQEKLTSITSTVRAAFAEAIHDGAASIAKAEVFSLLSGSGRGPDRAAAQESEPDTKPSAPTVVIDVTARDFIDKDVAKRLSVLGINSRQAFMLSTLLHTASRCGLMLVLRGAIARHCTQAMARHGAGNVAFVDVPMGLMSASEMSGVVREFDKLDALAILNADLSPIEVYGAKLLDLVAERVSDPNPSGKEIIISCHGGGISLPLPGILERLSLIVELDANWHQSGQTLDDLDLDSPALASGPKSMAIELVRGLNESDRKHVEGAFVKSIQKG